MSNLLNAANVDSNGFHIGELPVKSGEVSVMTIEQFYLAMETTPTKAGSKHDPSHGYNTSTYYVYAINDMCGNNDSLFKSTLTNLLLVGIDWYKELNKPTARNTHWDRVIGEEAHSVFGGPLWTVCRYEDGTYDFDWYYSEYERTCSSYINYWHDDVSSSAYVVVVHT